MSEALNRAIDEEKEISGYRQQNKKQKSSLFADLGISVSNQLCHQSGRI